MSGHQNLHAGLQNHFRARWTALRARLLRKQGLTAREMAPLLGCTKWAAQQYASWNGEGTVFARKNTRRKA